MEDRRLKVREIAEAIGMSSERVYHILTEELGNEKILLIDYLPTGQTITGQYYAYLLDQLQEKIREKRPGLKEDGPWHDSKTIITGYNRFDVFLFE
uniref:Uncharacterized protein n=1 Tax=Rhodnius prolixus TaxID=13249 RepID=T1HBU2_RHOPR